MDVPIVMAPAKRASLREQPRPVSISIADTAATLGVGRTTIYELIAARKLDTIKIGRRRLVLLPSLDRLITDARADMHAA